MTWGVVAGVSAAPLLSAAGSPTTTIALSDTTTTTVKSNTTTTTLKTDTTTTTVKSDTTTTTIAKRDLCPNIAGVQTTVPAGMFVNAAGNCVRRIVDLCVIGGTGPGGGIVFYVASTPQPWGRCLEIAPNTWFGGTADPALTWGCSGTNVANGSAIGTGQTNTTAIISACASNYIAARLADNLVFGGKSDWFLPSKGELAVIHIQRAIIGGFSIAYWSSTQSSANLARAQDFSSGAQFLSHKSKTSLYVRPIRAIP
jgi:hypothetical protein